MLAACQEKGRPYPNSPWQLHKGGEGSATARGVDCKLEEVCLSLEAVGLNVNHVHLVVAGAGFVGCSKLRDGVLSKHKGLRVGTRCWCLLHRAWLLLPWLSMLPRLRLLCRRPARPH